MKALVVGAGIGGLTTAVALRRAGMEVVVLERAAELGEAGAGLLLGANAVKVLDRLGLGGAVREAGAPTLVGGIFSREGQILTSLFAEQVTEMVGAESFAVHRADLQSVLLRALGDKHLRLGAELASFTQNEKNVRVFLVDGDEECADLLVGADGIYSKTRENIHGYQSPTYAGYTAWRGVVDYEYELLSRGGGFEFWGRGARFGCARMGGGRMYWFATRNAPEGGDDGPAGGRRALLDMFRGWHEPVVDLIEATSEGDIRRDDIYDRKPMNRWGEGRVTLLGDAAHPMTPNLGQGACQAIEDALALAGCLRERARVEEALELYEARRTRRTAAIVRLSRRMGWIGQLENPWLSRLRDVAVKKMPDRFQRRQLRMVLGYEP